MSCVGGFVDVGVVGVTYLICVDVSSMSLCHIFCLGFGGFVLGFIICRSLWGLSICVFVGGFVNIDTPST